MASTIVKAISGLLGGFSRLADAASHLPFVGDKFKGVSDKINAARGELDSFTGGLDALDGKQVNVDIVLTSHRREEGDLTSGGAAIREDLARNRKLQADVEKAATTAATVRSTAVADAEEDAERKAETQARARRKKVADRKARQDAADAKAALKKRNKRIVDAVKAEQTRAAKDVEKTGPLTKGAGLNTKKILEGMGLSPDEERELRGRLSSLGAGGQGLARPGGGTATTAARGFGGGLGQALVVESHTTINLDGQTGCKRGDQAAAEGRRRNPRQKRGPNRRGI